MDQGDEPRPLRRRLIAVKRLGEFLKCILKIDRMIGKLKRYPHNVPQPQQVWFGLPSLCLKRKRDEGKQPD